MGKDKDKKESKEKMKEEAHEHGGDCPFCACRDFFERAREDHESVRHFHNAQVEFLKGLRSVLDEGIAWMSKEPAEKKERVTKIVVE